MNKKKIDFTKSVYELCRKDPAVADVLASLGFVEITKPGMLQTAGRVMTIPKGALMRHVDMELIKKTFAEHGYEIINGGGKDE